MPRGSFTNSACYGSKLLESATRVPGTSATVQEPKALVGDSAYSTVSPLMAWVGATTSCGTVWYRLYTDADALVLLSEIQRSRPVLHTVQAPRAVSCCGLAFWYAQA